MANRLKMATSDTIRTLAAQGWSARRIARTLGLHRDTVARHLGRGKTGQAPTGSGDGKMGRAPTGDGPEPGDGAAGPPTPSIEVKRASASLCEPFRAAIQAKLDRGLTAQRIYQDLVGEHGFAGRYHSVRRFVRRLEAKQELPFRRLECGPARRPRSTSAKAPSSRTATGPAVGRTSSASS